MTRWERHALDRRAELEASGEPIIEWTCPECGRILIAVTDKRLAVARGVHLARRHRIASPTNKARRRIAYEKTVAPLPDHLARYQDSRRNTDSSRLWAMLQASSRRHVA